MEFYLEGCRLHVNGTIKSENICVSSGVFKPVITMDRDIPVFSGKGKILTESFCDLHTHLREPGFSRKETIKSGTTAAARGGFTTVCAMPNLDPVPDNAESLAAELALISKNAVIEVFPYAAITRGERGREISEIEDLSKVCCGFSDDGKGVQSGKLMKAAMSRIALCEGLIAAHTEDESKLKPGGSVHDGVVAKRYGLVGMPSASEYSQIERDLALVRETGCAYHVCHVSAWESLRLIKAAKSEGLPVTCEVTPHHLALSELDITEDSGRFKMNPPLRGIRDRESILSSIADGTVDVIATDHAPHTADEKSKGLRDSIFGTVGSETAFAVCNTYLVKTGVIGYERLFAMLCSNPREVIKKRTTPGWVLLDTEMEWQVKPEDFISMGRATPFEGMNLFGDVMMTVCDGEVVYMNGGFLSEYEAKAAF